MTEERSVGELRRDAGKVLDVVELESVYLVDSKYESQVQAGEIKLVSAYAVETRSGRSERSVTVWVRHRAFALAVTDEDDVPKDAAELSEAFVDERYAWRAETDWVAEYSAPAGSTDAFTTKELNAFAMVLGPPTVHPYARELVQSLVARGRYPAFTMGLLIPISAMRDDEVIEIEDA